MAGVSTVEVEPPLKAALPLLRREVGTPELHRLCGALLAEGGLCTGITRPREVALSDRRWAVVGVGSPPVVVTYPVVDL